MRMVKNLRLAKLKKELEETKAELVKVVSEVETLQSSYALLSSDRERLQHDYDQLGVEVKLKRHEAAAAAEWLSSDDGGMAPEPESQMLNVRKPDTCMYIHCGWL